MPAPQPKDGNRTAVYGSPKSIEDVAENEAIAGPQNDAISTRDYSQHAAGDDLLAVDDSDSELSDDPAPYWDRKLINCPQRPEEKFEPHDTDPTKIKAVFHFKLSNGSGWYTQRDELPEQRDSAEEDKFGENDSLFFPDLGPNKVPERPRLRKGLVHSPWVQVSPWRWEQQSVTGDTEVWSPKFVYRRFNARTHEYEKIYVAENKMENADPNDKRWVYAYNKWIDQIRRRSDSSWVAEKRRDHWKVTEICAMYAGFNEFIHTNGIDAYHGISVASLERILDRVNTAGQNNRGIDSLRGQVNSAHAGKNPSLAYLRDNVRDLVEYLQHGGVLSDDERFPEKFIPEAEFPTAPRKNARRVEVASKGRDKSGVVDIESDGDDELSDPPSDMEM